MHTSHMTLNVKNIIAPQIPEMMDRERMVIRRIAPTEKSVIR
jgi:hypothetical protein